MLSKELEASLHELRDTIIDGLDTRIESRLKPTEETLSKVIDAQDRLIAERKGIPWQGYERKAGVEGAISDALHSNEGKIRDFLQKKTAGDLVLETKAVGDVTMANITGGTVSVSSVRPGIISNPNRKQHLGELLPRVGGLTGDLVYLKENGPGEGDVTAVAEGAMKPQLDFDIAEATATLNYVAGWTKVSRRFLVSVPNATQWLSSRLTEKYYVAEDNLLLNGTGVSPQFKGLNVAGNFTAATSLAADPNFTQLVLGVGQLAALERNPDLIIMHPNDYYPLLINSASGSGEYTSPLVAQISVDGGNMKIAGVPVVVTTGQTAGTYTIIDRSGTLIGVAEGLNIRFFEQNEDDAKTNKILIRIESLMTLAVFGANYVIKGTF